MKREATIICSFEDVPEALDGVAHVRCHSTHCHDCDAPEADGAPSPLRMEELKARGLESVFRLDNS